MKYTLIKGTFHVVGYSPDGDSLMFKANNRARWDKLSTDHSETLQAKLDQEQGALQLRLQGIDALETHYTPPRLPTPPDLKSRQRDDQVQPSPGAHQQPAALAKLAAGELMHMLGFRRAEWRTWGTHTWVDRVYVERRGREVAVEEKGAEQVAGYIVTRDVDAKGRPIAWVFPGSTRTRDGTGLSQAQLRSRLERSANYQLLRRGLVYPYFFMTLPAVLREKLSEAVRAAMDEAAEGVPSGKAANIWACDRTLSGLRITRLSTITQRYEIFPYLFRRVIKHWYGSNVERYWEALRTGLSYSQDDEDGVSLKGFFERGNPYVFTVGERDFLPLDEVVTIKGGRLRMTCHPSDIVFLS
jgi:hypothetical protein